VEGFKHIVEVVTCQGSGDMGREGIHGWERRDLENHGPPKNQNF
jgi:hypothetical protein